VLSNDHSCSIDSNAMTDSNFLRRVLREYKTIAMVGLSSNWSRPSNFVAKYLLDRGFTVIPVNPKSEILGQKCYPNLESIPVPVDIVDLFQRSDRVEPFVDSAIQIKAKLVWMQLGVVNEKAAQKAQDAGLDVVMNLCPKIEYARLFGGLNTVGVNTGVISSRRPKFVNR
jgi:predicted CoA-binding protein